MRTEPANCGRFASIEGNDRPARVAVAMVQFLGGETANLSFAPKLDSGCCCPRAVRPSPIPNALGSIILSRHTHMQRLVSPRLRLCFSLLPESTCTTSSRVIYEQKNIDNRR